MVNGRVTKEYDSYTCVSSRGSSVVYYMLVPHSTLEKCDSFKVHLVKDLIDPIINTVECLPDLSVLELCIKMGFTSDMITSETDICFNVNDSDKSCEQTSRKFAVKNIPNNFLSSEITRLAISKCVETMLTSKETQTEIDSLYDSVCDVYYAEMNALLNYKDVGPASYKRGRHSAKPFWTNELSVL